MFLCLESEDGDSWASRVQGGRAELLGAGEGAAPERDRHLPEGAAGEGDQVHQGEGDPPAGDWGEY